MRMISSRFDLLVECAHLIDVAASVEDADSQFTG
jgi:hypothetical protein